MASVFFINPSRQSKALRAAAPARDRSTQAWLPSLLVRSDFLLWTRTHKISPTADFVLLVNIAITLGSPPLPQGASEC